MKKSSIVFLILISIVFHPLKSSAQKYGTTFGLRFGNNDYYRSIGLTAEQRFLKNVTFEGIIQSDFSRNLTGHLLIKKHRPILGKRLNYHYGAGISTGLEESFVKNPESNTITHTYGNGTLNADLMLGVELTILNSVVSLDYKPNFNLAGRHEFYRGQVGISVRTVLVKSKELKKKRRKKARMKRRQERKEGKVENKSFWIF